MLEQSRGMDSITPWETWIAREDLTNSVDFDGVCEYAVKKFNITNKERDPILIDVLQFFLLWWRSNRDNMVKYQTYKSIGHLIDKSHSSVLYHLKKRQPTYNYNTNTSDIKDFLKN